MIRKHRMSIIPAGALIDLVKRILGEKGKLVEIAGRQYTLREKGDLEKNNQIRVGMLKNLEMRLMKHPNTRQDMIVELGDTKEVGEPTYRIRFTKAEEIPPIEQDVGEHSYIIVDGTRYRVDEDGDVKKACSTTSEMIKQGTMMIRAEIKDKGRFPNEIELAAYVEKRIGPFKIWG